MNDEEKMISDVHHDAVAHGSTYRDNDAKISSEDTLNSASCEAGKLYNNNLIDLDLDRKLVPPCIDANNNNNGNNDNNMQRGRQRQPRIKDHGYVPQFVHIPNTTANDNTKFDSTKRAPSVPDLISYSHEGNIAESNNTDTNLLLSNETLRDKDQESRKEQLEERLKRAHLRLNSDTDLSETRYRSKSTPSRGGGMRLPSLSDRQRFAGLYIGSNTGLISHADESNGISNGESNTSLIHANVSQLETSNLAEINVSSRPLQQQHADTPNSVVYSSVKSSHGSHCSRTLLSDDSLGRGENILEPPPPRPPATEKERLVERERQARLETERARRRHLALQRERQVEEENDSVVESEGSDDNVALLGQVSFDAELATDPEFVRGLPMGNSSAGSSSISIPRPPLPPPPATERERLVERERQARLETERARRRQALLRERDLEELDEESVSSSDNNADLQRERNDSETNGVVASLNRTVQEDDTTGMVPAQDEVEHTEAEAGLSYPMERFLDRVDDEPSIIPVDTSAVVENDATTALPYTMELFLAENVTDTSVSQIHQPNSTEPLIDPPSIQPSLDFEANNNEVLDGDQNETSIASVNASIPLAHDAENSHTNHTNSQVHENSRTEHSDSSPSSQDSFDVNPSAHLTEADIAQLADVEHASTQGNAAPHSVRDEPSEASVVERGVFLGDNAFSVATQTTMMVESVTEASERPFSDINENESLEVIRVAGSGISIQTGSSVEERHSRANSHVGGENLLYSLAPSSHDSIGMPRLTEAGIGTMVDIDQASIAGNAPPQSVRDERLSESSVAERGGHHHFSTTPITEISSVDDSLSNQRPENASVEVMPSEHSDQSDIDEPEEEDTIASIDALPSIDLENESATHQYGAIDAANVSHYSAESLSEDIESAPLLSARRDGRATPSNFPNSYLDSLASIEEGREKPDEPFPSLLVSLALIVAEIPTFIVIAQQNDQLYSQLGVERYQIVIASLVVMTSIVNQSAKDKPISIEGGAFNTEELIPDWPYVLDELQKSILLGFFIGLLSFVLSNLGIWFSVVVSFSTALAKIISRLCKLCFAWMLRKLIHPSHIQRFSWIEESVMAGFQDCIRCLVYLKSLSLIMVVNNST